MTFRNVSSKQSNSSGNRLEEYGIARGLVGSVIAAALLVACVSSGADYEPASEPGDQGYSEQQITENRYRVTFIGDSHTPRETVQDLALLRAAELTIQKDFDWFAVDDRATIPLEPGNDLDGRVEITTQPAVETRCGLLGCTSSHYSPAYAATEVRFPDSSPELKTNIEIMMGVGNDRPGSAYDAREVIDSIRSGI